MMSIGWSVQTVRRYPDRNSLRGLCYPVLLHAVMERTNRWDLPGSEPGTLCTSLKDLKIFTTLRLCHAALCRNCHLLSEIWLIKLLSSKDLLQYLRLFHFISDIIDLIIKLMYLNNNYRKLHMICYIHFIAPTCMPSWNVRVRFSKTSTLLSHCHLSK